MTDKEITDFIKHGENGFGNFALTFGDGWAGQAIDIAKALRIALAQPGKEWVGLTDEEVSMIRVVSGTNTIAIKMTEAKLKEKNND